MRKIMTIASREYRAMVGTKAFLISIVMMPVLMFGSMAAMSLLQNVGEIKERKIVVFDGGNSLFESLQQAAEAHNESVRGAVSAAQGTETSGETTSEPNGMSTMTRGELFLLEKSPIDSPDEDLLLEMSEKIRAGEYYGFVDLPPGLIANTGQTSNRVQFYSQDSSIADARSWLTQTLNQVVRSQRLSLEFAEDQRARIELASRPIAVVGMGLAEKSVDGQVKSAQEKSEMADIFLPLGLMMLMFMVIFMAAQPMLESVLEEKSQRIAEVMLGSVSSFQLMMGKLLGTVSGSLTIFVIYMAGSYFVAQDRGWTENIPFHLLPWFVVFQIFGVLFYASIFLAIGASVSQLKEAQSMLLPVWMMMMLPLFVWLLIIRDPLGPMAVWISLFPPATSTTMVLRLATNQPIPTLELVGGLLLLIASTLIMIVVAGRIFRVGILWQGKVPKINELLRWALRG